MWVAVLDGKNILGFNRRPKRIETETTVGFKDAVERIGCHVPKDGSWKVFTVKKMVKVSNETKKGRVRV